MNVEVINTGTELLLGSIVNTHAAYFGTMLFPVGLRISRQTTVPDGNAIRDVLIEAFGRCDVLLVTGGLGPTTDDVTRESTADLLGRRLIADPAVEGAIRERCLRRGYPFLDRMRRQTMVPEGAVVLPNANGTAPGLYFPATAASAGRTPHLFLLPGPPRELMPIFEDAVLPRLREWAGKPTRQCKVYRCVGIGESQVEDRVGFRLSSRPDVEVGYCARPNEVDFRLIGAPEVLAELDPVVTGSLGECLLTEADESLEQVVVRLLREGGRSLATAESCTGGLLAHRITNVPGSSEVFLGGWVTYSNAVKMSALGVSAETLAAHGAVSDPVTRAMAEGALARSGADFALSTTGIAGPGGGTPEKPVGTVHLALAQKGCPAFGWMANLESDRETFKRLATQAALDALRRELIHGDGN